VAWYLDIVLYIWGLFTHWLRTIFVLPFQTTEMLWLLVPVWMAWFFAEFFQEKTGTSLGNAISNAVVILWGSVDCSRQTVALIAKHTLVGFWNIFARFAMIFIIFIYGVIIVFFGIKGNKIIKYIGRIREITYVFAMFTPIFYGAIPLTWNHIISAIVFFPLFYFAIELIDRYTPDPKAITEDAKDVGVEAGRNSGGNSLDSFNSFNKQPGTPGFSQNQNNNPQGYRPPYPPPGNMNGNGNTGFNNQFRPR